MLNIKFLLSSLKTITKSKDCSKSRIKFLFWLFFSLIGRFSPVCNAFMAGFSEQFSGSKAVYEQLLESQVAIRKLEYATVPEDGYWKDFHYYQVISVNRNFSRHFLQKKTAKSCRNHQRSFQKVLFRNFRTFKKHFYFVTLSLSHHSATLNKQCTYTPWTKLLIDSNP